MARKPKTRTPATCKRKLRTAADVISRLRWSGDESTGGVLIGYDDRIHGPMEKPLEDYVRIDRGGDIPEHRIQYFCRRGENHDASILWDRLGRVDRVFGSGNGADAPVDPRTEQMAVHAMSNMTRLEEEKQARREKREQHRARRAKRSPRATISHCQEITVATPDRYSWTSSDWYTFSTQSNEWTVGGDIERDEQMSTCKSSELVVVTWNVLFDLYDDEIENHMDSEFIDDNESTLDRWQLLVSCLERTIADVIALQEVTPNFAELLLAQPWVQHDYSSSATAKCADSVDPCGNLLLWRSDRLRVVTNPSNHKSKLCICQDGPRKRATIAALQLLEDPATILLCANVHLPADKPLGKGMDCRALARQRELLAVVGRQHIMERQILSEANMDDKSLVVPVIAGDFNTQEVMMDDYFVDSWPLVTNSEIDHTFTFDPETNMRAAKSKRLTQSTKGPRTIDRILVAKTFDGVILLTPLDGKLLGVADNIEVMVPPSDHYGLQVSFRASQRHISQPRPTLSQQVDGCSAWASHATPTTDTLLALVLDETSLGGTQLFDTKSSLPVPHVTLMHGFVELDSLQSRILATQAIERAVQLVFCGSNNTGYKAPVPSLALNRESFSVFEHRNSATLVCLPDTSCGDGQWLLHLYDILKALFRLCREQDDRFQDGWTPHLSLGTYGTAASARSEINRIISSEQWMAGGMVNINTSSIGLFQRDPSNGQFYAVSTVPLAPRQKDVSSCCGHRFLMDAGLSRSKYMRGLCTPLLIDIERHCQRVIGATDGSLSVSVQVYGSYAMEASLPNMSDVDALIVVQSSEDSYSKTHQLSHPTTSSTLFPDLISHLKKRYSLAKTRVRPARRNKGGFDPDVLTVKLWPHAPFIDLQLCSLDSDGMPLDAKSSVAYQVIRDTALILDTARACSQRIPVELDAVRIFQGALRIVKVWAHRRQVYGPSLGYVGGGGWAVMLARVMYDSLQDATLLLTESNTIEQASFRIAAHFFKLASQWERPFVVTLPPMMTGERHHAADDVRDSIKLSMERGTMAVIAPVSGGNFARNTFPCTVHTMGEELKNAATSVSAMRSLDNSLEMTLRPLGLNTFLATFRSIVLVEIAIPDKTSGDMLMADLKGCASVAVLGVILALEQLVGDPSRVRPSNKPINLEGAFVYLIGGDFNFPQEQLERFCSQQSESMKAQLEKHFFPVPKEQSRATQIRCLDSSVAPEYLDSLLK